jgi:hypothetical protein
MYYTVVLYMWVWVIYVYGNAGNSGGFHVALISDGLVSSVKANDADIVVGSKLWKEEWGKPQGHNEHDAGFNQLSTVSRYTTRAGK